MARKRTGKSANPESNPNPPEPNSNPESSPNPPEPNSNPEPNPRPGPTANSILATALYRRPPSRTNMSTSRGPSPIEPAGEIAAVDTQQRPNLVGTVSPNRRDSSPVSKIADSEHPEAPRNDGPITQSKSPLIPGDSGSRQTSIATSASPRLASQVQGSPLTLNRALEGEFNQNPNSPHNVQNSPAANPALTSTPMRPPVRAQVSAAPGTPISPITPGGSPARPLNLDGGQSPNPHIRRELSTQGRLNLSPELGDQLGSPSAAEQAAEIVRAVSSIDIRNETDRDNVSTVKGDVQRVLSSTPATREEDLKKLNATAEKLKNEGDEWRKISYLMLALGGTILALGAASLLVSGSAASAVCTVVGAGLCLAGFGFFHRGNNADPRLPFANVTPDTTHYSPIPTGWA
jgi:hypothetical protein